MPTLEWIGKSKVINHHLDVPYRVLERQYSYDENGKHTADNGSENMIIHGDNLLALKSLLPQYEGQIDCIYIDPPYNTGNEKWVYNDNVNDPQIKKWLGEVVGPEGEDLSRHDKWLCMMYPRLKLLHKLLSKDGAIFISIDHRESYHLRCLLNEIFGTNNFVSEIACINNPKGRSDDKYFATAHELILVYRKTDLFSIGTFLPEEKVIKRYNKVDESGRKYREIDLRKTGDHDLREDRPNLFYPFYFNKKTKSLSVEKPISDSSDMIVVFPMKEPSVEGNWRWGKETAAQQIDSLICKYMPTKKQYGIFEKDYLDIRDGVTPTTNWDFKDVNSERGTEMFIKYLGFSKQDFPNPKPVGTIQRILSLALPSNGVILDSFAGSGTTAHAVLNMNKQDGGNRKFILVEMMDYAETITAERVKRVIGGYGEGKNAIDGTGGSFSYYELGAPLLIDGILNPDVTEDRIREYIYFTETKQRLAVKKEEEPFYLGTNLQTAYYFYYEKMNATTLNREFLHTVKTKADRYLIYADLCTLSDDELDKYHITFKKIPRDITKL